jgi:hypothetical protein
MVNWDGETGSIYGRKNSEGCESRNFPDVAIVQNGGVSPQFPKADKPSHFLLTLSSKY